MIEEPAPELGMAFRIISIGKLFEGWTDDQIRRFENASETSYRRGFTQGAHTVSEVVSNARVDKWLDGALYSWRYSDREKIVFPPSISRSKR